MKFCELSRIAEFNIPYFEVVAEDVFLLYDPLHINKKWLDRSVRELASAANLEIDETLAYLLKVSKLAEGILIDKDSIKEPCQYIDVSLDPRPNSQLIWLYDLDIMNWLNNVKTKSQPIVFCSHEGSRSFGAAMYFRSNGLINCFALRSYS